MDRVLDQLNIRPQWAKVTGKGVRGAVLDYAPGNLHCTPINSAGYMHYHSYSCQLIGRTIAPDCEQFGINVLGKVSEGSWPLQDGLRWCLENNIQVINLSLSATSTPERIDLIKQLVAKKVLIFAASGNESDDEVNFPANQPGVISVGAYSVASGLWMHFSNKGIDLKFIAPTFVVLPHWEKDKLPITFSGTSCATPCGYGGGMLWKEVHPDGDGYDFIKFLKEKATEDYGVPGFDTQSGWGKFKFPAPEVWLPKLEVDILVDKVGVDYGHGGTDPGAIGAGGMKEKDVTLAVGCYLGELLTNNNFMVLLTREKDETMSLAARSDKINQAGCDIAVSVHVNSVADSKPSYIATFIQAQGGKAETLGLYIQRHLVKATGWQDGGVRVQNNHMTRETNMPAVLVELGFISNPTQEAWLKDPANHRKLAEAIARGVCDFACKPYKVKEVTPVITLKGEDFDADAKVVFKGKEIQAGIVTLPEGGKTFIEIRAVAELLGLKVEYDNPTKTVTLS